MDDDLDELAWLKLDDVSQTVDVSEIEHMYQTLELEEARIEVEISDCVDHRASVDMRLAQLSALHKRVEATHLLVKPMQQTIDATAGNAGVISGHVRELDQERVKLEHALNTVRETVELKERLSELLTAMEARDVDRAATLVHEYGTTSSDTLDSPFIPFAAPDSSQPPRDIISAATKELVERVTFMFDAAVESNNTREISRCFRLFPQLGETQRGLDAYSEFLCAAITDKTRLGQVHVSYALRVTRLFEAIASVVDSHFALVEQYYGKGYVLRVIQRLQMEGARRACLVLDFFEEERQVKRRLAQIQQADVARPWVPPRPSVKAKADLDDGISDVDFKDIASILAEVVLIGRQVAAFDRFLESRAQPEALLLLDDPEAQRRVFLSSEAIGKLVPLSTGQNTMHVDEQTGLVAHTQLTSRIEWLTCTYVAFETFCVKRSMAKAMSLDDTDALSGWDGAVSSDLEARAQGPPAGTVQTSSCVGDVFFVAKTSLEHAVAVQQAEAVEAVAQCVLEAVGEFVRVMEQRAAEKWADGAGVQRRILVSLNNLDLANVYLQKMVDELRVRLDSEWARASDAVKSRGRNAIDSLSALSSKLLQAQQHSIDQLSSMLLKPWMRSILQHSYRDIKYVLSDEEFNDVQSDNLFQQRFELRVRKLGHQLRPRLLPTTYALVVESMCVCLVYDWERAIRQSKFNMLGGMMFEKDVRFVQLCLEREANGVLRARFARLVQMARVVAEPVDAVSVAGVDKDVRAMLANRVDMVQQN
ncbi:Golgi transport complex subunit 4 [Coemansia sp. RSA 1822]|nr:Golgi transport complex subunit 4 [Coemansia sp. RSA 638]KAJ2122837.1 Golgi transport complex subunit 4 [Coemansia sp. RSA 720]KAJ2543888.1 Golgi transport complex subunit 4 [Coemansia sp. RSA 1853]KAJ2558520.1 Golgi transport complex subunit 4 [Coemansia sp. RSA 1822]